MRCCLHAADIPTSLAAPTCRVLEDTRQQQPQQQQQRQPSNSSVGRASQEELAAALAFYRQHNGQAPQRAQPSTGTDELDATKEENWHLVERLQDAEERLAQQKQEHEAQLLALQAHQEEIVQAMVRSQTKDFTGKLSTLRAAVEQQCMVMMQQQVADRQQTREALAEVASLKAQLKQLQGFTQNVVDTYGGIPGFPAPPADSGVSYSTPAEVEDAASSTAMLPLLIQAGDVHGARDQQQQQLLPGQLQEADSMGFITLSGGRKSGRFHRTHALEEGRNVHFVSSPAADVDERVVQGSAHSRQGMGRAAMSKQLSMGSRDQVSGGGQVRLAGDMSAAPRGSEHISVFKSAWSSSRKWFWRSKNRHGGGGGRL